MSVISGGGEVVVAVVRMRMMKRRGRRNGCITLSVPFDCVGIVRPREDHRARHIAA